jgi:hypothetical protein
MDPRNRKRAGHAREDSETPIDDLREADGQVEDLPTEDVPLPDERLDDDDDDTLGRLARLER